MSLSDDRRNMKKKNSVRIFQTFLTCLPSGQRFLPIRVAAGKRIFRVDSGGQSPWKPFCRPRASQALSGPQRTLQGGGPAPKWRGAATSSSWQALNEARNHGGNRGQMMDRFCMMALPGASQDVQVGGRNWVYLVLGVFFPSFVRFWGRKMTL